MSNRRQRANAKNKTVAYIAAGVVHLIIIALLVFNFASKPKTTEAAYAEKVDLVKATTVDESVIRKQQEKLKQAELDREREKQKELDRLARIKKDAEKEQKNLDELKKKSKLQKEKAVEEAAERKAIALKKKKEDEERKKREAEEKRKKDVERVAKQKKQEEKAEKERVEKEREQEEAQRLLNESMAAEDAFQAEKMAKERATNLSGKYTALITGKVKSKWSVSPNFERWRTAEVSVKLSPSGDVLSAVVVKSSGSQQFDRSVETAVRQATPLPIPTVEEDPEVNKLFQTLTIDINMSGM